MRKSSVCGAYSAILLLTICLSPCLAAERLEILRSVPYAKPNGEELTADVYLPPGTEPHPAVLVVHGGAWTIGNKSHLGFAARQFAEAGFCAVAINYRLAPKHKFPAQLEDCRSAVAWMRANAEKYHIDPKRIGGYGYSAGGHLVALLGSGVDLKPADGEVPADRPDCHLQAVVAGGAPCDFCTLPAEETTLAFWLGGPRKDFEQLYQLASPAQHITAQCPPMFFFHGADDSLVPLLSPKSMSIQLVKLGVTSELFVVPGKGHLLAMFDQEALTRGIEFLKRHLTPAP